MRHVHSPLSKIINAALPGAVLFLLLPLLVYVTNLNDVLVPKADILTWGLAAWGGSLLALCPIVALPRTKLPLILCGGAGLGLAIVVVFLPVDAPPLAGHIAEAPHLVDTLIAMLKLGAAMGTCMLLLRLRPALADTLSGVVLLFTIGLALWTTAFVTAESERALTEGRRNMQATSTIGHERSIILVLFDNVRGDAAERLLATRPQVRQWFHGFTLYPNALGVAGSTYFTVPVVYAGRADFLPRHQTVNGIFGAAYADSIFTDAADAGFQPAGAFYASMPRGGLPYTSCLDWHRTPRAALGGAYAYAKHMAVSLRRILPAPFVDAMRSSAHTLRRRVTGRPPRTKQSRHTPQGVTPHDLDIMLKSRRSLVNWRDALRVGDTPSTLLFFHSLVTHSPYVFGADGSILPRPDEEATTLYGLRLMHSIITRLEGLGVLDSTLVVFLSDHGHGLDGGNFNPLLMVRMPGDSAPYRTDPALVWHGDIRPALRRFMAGKSGGEFLDAHQRGRDFIDGTFYHVPTTGRFIPPAQLPQVRMRFTGNHGAIQRALDAASSQDE